MGCVFVDITKGSNKWILKGVEEKVVHKESNYEIIGSSKKTVIPKQKGAKKRHQRWWWNLKEKMPIEYERIQRCFNSLHWRGRWSMNFKEMEKKVTFMYPNYKFRKWSAWGLDQLKNERNFLWWFKWVVSPNQSSYRVYLSYNHI